VVIIFVIEQLLFQEEHSYEKKFLEECFAVRKVLRFAKFCGSQSFAVRKVLRFAKFCGSQSFAVLPEFET